MKNDSKKRKKMDKWHARRSINWADINWGMNDAAIGRLKGCSREAVRQNRVKLGIARSPNWHAMEGGMKHRLRGMGTTGKTLKEIQAEIGGGYSTGWIRQVLVDSGKTWRVVPPQYRCKYNWAAVGDAEWDGLSNKEIGLRCGVANLSLVAQRRGRLLARRGRVLVCAGR